MVTVVRFFAAAQQVVGVNQVELNGELTTIADALASVDAFDPVRWLALSERCSYLLDGVSTRDLSSTIAGVSVIDVMPPFAGG